MAVDKREVRKIAGLARLALSPEEIDRIEVDLNNILDHIDQIQAAPTDGVSEEIDPAAVGNVFRADEPGPSLDREEALKNAPDSDGAYFRVPPVLPSTEH